MKLNLDLTTVEKESASIVSLLPAGKYDAVIFSTDVKETKSKNGFILTIFFRVIGSEHGSEHNDKVFRDGLNIVNKNVDAQRIALSRLKLIAELAGLKNPNKIDDSEELHGKKLTVTLTCKDMVSDNGNHFTVNEVKKYDAYANGTQEYPSKVVEKLSSDKMPWEK